MENETVVMDGEQLKMVEKLEKVVNFLKCTPIKSQESLQYLNKPIDDLLSTLKYLPTDPPFSFLPTEIKTDILGYLCNSGTLVAASVCQEWNTILAPRLNELDQVAIGKSCSNEYKCQDGKCCMPEAMLKTLKILKLEVPLAVCHPLTEVDPQAVSEGLASAYALKIKCDCTECDGDDSHDGKSFLTNEQKEQFLVALDNRTIAMKMLYLRKIDLSNLDQDRLVNCLFNKTKSLVLHDGDHGPILDIRKLVEKLKDSSDHRLQTLGMNRVQYPDDLAEDMADALCQMINVGLLPHFHLKMETLARLLQNILTRPIRTKVLDIIININWSTLIDPDDLKIMVDKMKRVVLWGTFTQEQLQAARSCPGVTVTSNKISKLSNF